MTDNRHEESYLPLTSPPTNHGHTVAAWTAMIGVMAGSLVSSVAVALAVVWLFWAGMVVVAAALVAGLVLRNMGYGQPRESVRPLRTGSGR